MRRSQGSSPLTRGKRGAADSPAAPPRLIPAHAGKTTGRLSSGPCTRAHPRSRGENWMNSSSVNRRNGSSPLTRGKQRAYPDPRTAQRLIPAHAGKTGFINGISSMIGAHPRSRGENQGHHERVLPSGGSSPLTRGKPKGAPPSVTVIGLIPAHAGKTEELSVEERLTRAHPRSRGENKITAAFLFGSRGSSPLTRGKPTHSAQRPHAPGLIPAHAGKTRRGGAAGCRPRAHPRSRGENARAIAA